LLKKDKRFGTHIAPNGVILYFEGLDCSGKSSTGGLVQAALEQAGYTVGYRQYNRPPTAEQRERPWMDRFEVPGAAFADTDVSLFSKSDEDEDGPPRVGLVWDRGPAGETSSCTARVLGN